jgi:hypothetical protein
MPNKMKSNNPPRRVDIRGQDHLLAYITPDEAQLLMDNGGTGESGPMGIPAFVRGFGGETSEQEARDSGAGGISKDDIDRGNQDASDRQAERDLDRQIAAEIANRQAYEAKVGGITPGQATAMFGDATMAGKGFTSKDIDRMLGSASVDVTGILPELQRRARRSSQFSTLGKILSPTRMLAESVLGLPKGPTSYDNLATLIGMPGSTIMSGGLLGPDAVLGVPTGGIGAFGTPANLSQGYFGQVTYTGMPDEDYTGPFQDLVRPDDERLGGDGPDTVPPVYNPTTGESQCPDGYVFDANLQACRLDTTLQNVDDTVGGDGFTYQPGTYARMGLLDVAPEGLEGFASTYGTGFGTSPDFEAANLAYRKPVGTMSGIFQDPYNLEGMTLLS